MYRVCDFLCVARLGDNGMHVERLHDVNFL